MKECLNCSNPPKYVADKNAKLPKYMVFYQFKNPVEANKTIDLIWTKW